MLVWNFTPLELVTYYVFETMTLCRLSRGLGPVAYEHRVPALTQWEHGHARSHLT